MTRSTMIRHRQRGALRSLWDGIGASRAACLGYGWMALAVLIWASWLVLSASGRATALSVLDLAFFRAAIPTAILAPVLWRHRHVVARLGVTRCLLLSAYGAPFTLCVGYGLTHAPVAHAGAFVPGLMPVFAMALSHRVLGEPLPAGQLAAAALILSGAVTIALQGADSAGTGPLWLGHIFFLLGAFCWASFTVTLRAVDISPFLATAIVGALSTLGLLPLWLWSDLSNLSMATRADIAFQALFQGLISGLVSMFAFSRALRLIGGQAATLSALTPGVAAGLAAAFLGEIPSLFDGVAIGLVVIGLVLRVSGSRPKAADLPSEQNGKAL